MRLIRRRMSTLLLSVSLEQCSAVLWVSMDFDFLPYFCLRAISLQYVGLVSHASEVFVIVNVPRPSLP